MAESKLRFKVGDRVAVAKYGVGTVTEVNELWKNIRGEQKPCQRPYKVVLDPEAYEGEVDSVRLLGQLCEEAELTPAPKSASAGK